MCNFIPTGKVYMAGAGEAIPDAEVLNGRCVAFKVHEGVLKEIAVASGAEAVRYVGAYEDGHASLRTVDADAAARGELSDTGNGTGTTTFTLHECDSIELTDLSNEMIEIAPHIVETVCSTKDHVIGFYVSVMFRNTEDKNRVLPVLRQPNGNLKVTSKLFEIGQTMLYSKIKSVNRNTI